MTARIISSEPEFAKTLKAVNLGIIPEGTREFIINWIERVGKTVRSEEAITGLITDLPRLMVMFGVGSLVGTAIVRTVFKK